jgi:hypothetical protein
MAGDDSVSQVALTVQAEIRSPVRYKRVELDERICVKQQLDSLAGCQFSAIVLLLNAYLSPTESRLIAQ